MSILKGRELVLKKTYIRDECDKCMKRTRLIIFSKITDNETGMDSYNVQCEICLDRFIVERKTK